MSSKTFEELKKRWRNNQPPVTEAQKSHFMLMQIPHIGKVYCRVRYDPARRAYELHFVQPHTIGYEEIDLVTERVMVRMIRLFIRNELGIKHIPSLKVIEPRKSTLPRSLFPKRVLIQK